VDLLIGMRFDLSTFALCLKKSKAELRLENAGKALLRDSLLAPSYHPGPRIGHECEKVPIAK